MFKHTYINTSITLIGPSLVGSFLKNLENKQFLLKNMANPPALLRSSRVLRVLCAKKEVAVITGPTTFAGRRAKQRREKGMEEVPDMERLS